MQKRLCFKRNSKSHDPTAAVARLTACSGPAWHFLCDGAGRDVQEEGPVVHTAEGPVRGFVKDGVYEFLGIPYAAPPVGPLRWMPPQPVKYWREPLNKVCEHLRSGY